MNKPDTITAITIERAWRGVGNIVIADGRYAVPEKTWLKGVARTLKDNRKPYGKANDCDDFAVALKLRAQELHAMAQPEIDGLAVGIVFYKPESTTAGHAINWSLTAKGELWFLEPQNGEEVFLSESERQSVSFVYC